MAHKKSLSKYQYLESYRLFNEKYKRFSSVFDRKTEFEKIMPNWIIVQWIPSGCGCCDEVIDTVMCKTCYGCPTMKLAKFWKRKICPGYTYICKCQHNTVTTENIIEKLKHVLYITQNEYSDCINDGIYIKNSSKK